MTAAKSWVLPESWVLPDGRTVTPETETLLDFLEYSADECGKKLKECQPLSDSYSFWSGSLWAYSFAAARCRSAAAETQETPADS